MQPVVTQLRQYQQQQRSPIDETSDIARRRSVNEISGSKNADFEMAASENGLQMAEQRGRSTVVRQSWTPSQSSADSAISRPDNRAMLIRQTTGPSATSVGDDHVPSVNDAVERFNGDTQQFAGRGIDAITPLSQVHRTSYDINFNVKGGNGMIAADEARDLQYWAPAMTSRVAANKPGNGFRRDTTAGPTKGDSSSSARERSDIMPDNGSRPNGDRRKLSMCVYQHNVDS
jgi:hypothetical protein